MKEFNIKSRNELFRIKDIAPTTLLALRSTIDFDSLELTDKLYSFILENIEVNIKNSWLNVKGKGMQIYYPSDLATDLTSLDELIQYFLAEYLKPLFTKSNE